MACTRYMLYTISFILSIYEWMKYSMNSFILLSHRYDLTPSSIRLDLVFFVFFCPSLHSPPPSILGVCGGSRSWEGE
jgi:hypothetical protein